MAEGEQVTIIGRDAKFKGEMAFDNSAKILGGFEGKIIAKGEVTIGETATCKASIEAGTVLVDGPIEGDIVARERIQLTNKARVKGDIVAGSLSVAEGAAFIGHCRVGPDVVRPDGTVVELEVEPKVRKTRDYSAVTASVTTAAGVNGVNGVDAGNPWLASKS